MGMLATMCLLVCDNIAMTHVFTPRPYDKVRVRIWNWAGLSATTVVGLSRQLAIIIPD